MAFWGPGPSARSSSSGYIRKINLQSFTSSRGSQVHHVRGKHLSIEDVHKTLANNDRQLNESGQKMLETLENVKPNDFQLTQQQFVVSFLQHVTDCESMEIINDQEGFRIVNQTSRPGFGDLLFWSAGIALEEVEEACERSYEDICEEVPEAITYEERIKDQFANSPAFNESASRYGNFKFSFSLFELLDLYQAQHCRGGEPQLRILGTDLYKQEIAHYILVHSPDNTVQFRDLPKVSTVHGNSKSLPFVYEKNGILYWRPESTSSALTVMISEQGIAPRECPMPCDYFNGRGYCTHIRGDTYEVWSVWNHLVFAFHLPNNRHLKIPKGKLLNNLTACSIDEPALVEECRQMCEEEAEDIIRQIKNDFRMRKKMRTS